MPAPMPINIRYGNPSDLMSLAGSAGAAQNSMDLYKQQYQGWLQRMSMDQSFLENEANRRQADSHFTQTLAASQQAERDRMAASQSSSEMQDVYRQQLLDLKEKAITGGQRIDQEKVDSMNARLAAQTSGNIGSGRGRSSAPVDLVPAEGDINQQPQREPSTITDENGNVTEMRNGTPITYQKGDLATQSWARSEADKQNPKPSEMVSREVRRQLDMINAEKATLSPEDYSALRTSAMSGTVKADQMIDNLRQAKMKAPKTPTPTYEAKTDAKLAEILHQTESLMNASDAQKVAWAKRDAGNGGEFLDDPAALDRFSMANANAKSILAYQRPVTNSQGTTPTGGNVIKVNTPADAARLPSGTVYMAPDGQLRRIP